MHAARSLATGPLHCLFVLGVPAFEPLLQAGRFALNQFVTQVDGLEGLL